MATIEDREAELAALQSSFDEYIESSRMLEEELDAELNKMQRRLGESSHTNQTLSAQLENVTPQLSSLERALAKANEALSQETENRRRAETRQDEAEARARAADGTIERLRDENDRALQEVAFKDDEMEELRVMMEVDKETHQGQLNELREEIHSLRCGVATNTASPAKDYAEDEERAAYVTNLEDELELVTEQLIEANELATELQDRLNETERPPDVVGDAENEDVPSSLSTTAGASALQSRLTAATEDLARAEDELGLAREELSLTREELAATEQDLETARRERDATASEQRKERNEAGREMERTRLEVESARMEVDTITNSLLETNRTGEETAEELDALRRAHDHARRDNGALAEENRALKRRHDDTKRELAKLRRDLAENAAVVHDSDDTLPPEGRRETASDDRSTEPGTFMESDDDDDFARSRPRARRDASSALRRTRSSSPCVSRRTETDLEYAAAEAARHQRRYRTLRDQYHIALSRMRRMEEDVRRLKEDRPLSNGNGGGSPHYTVPLDPNDLERTERARLDEVLATEDPVRLADELRLLFDKAAEQRERNNGLLSQIIRLQANIRVCCRIRPVGPGERVEKVVAEPLSDTEVGCFDGRTSAWRSYAFDRVWGPDHDQSCVYRDVEPLATSVVDGYNACILAYGQTGSGKTYTMEGDPANDEHGVSYRILQKIFNLLHIRQRKEEAAGKTNHRFSIEVGMFEIYNEDVYDLLIKNQPSSAHPPLLSGADRRATLDVRRGADGRIEVADLTKERVRSVRDVVDLLSRGNRRRATASTNLNERSSRSHMILQVRVTVGVPDDVAHVGNLFLVDLAGSERVRRSAVEGKEMREAQHINKSLSALGNVMEALDRKAAHVPYRNSKLTHLLQDSLSVGGNSRTMMLVTVRPDAASYDETTTSLLFATRARRVHLGAARRNVAESKNLESTVRSLTEEMKVLAKAKKRKDEQLVEMRKAHERIQVRLAASTESRKEADRGESRAMTVLRRSNSDAVARCQKERSAKEKLAAELEEARKETRKLQQRLATRHREKDEADGRQTALEAEVGQLRKKLRESNDRLSSANIRLRTNQILSPATRKSVANPPPPPATERTPTRRRSVSNTANARRRPMPSKTTTTTTATTTTSTTETPSSSSAAAVRERVTAFLRRHDPVKVDRVDALLEKFRGNEAALMRKLAERYENDTRSVRSELSVGKMSTASATNGNAPSSAKRRARDAMDRHRERMAAMQQTPTTPGKRS